MNQGILPQRHQNTKIIHSIIPLFFYCNALFSFSLSFVPLCLSGRIVMNKLILRR